MAYLFDTDAISELLKKAPLAAYVRWVSGLRREDQFTSSVVIAELFAGAYLLAADGRRDMGQAFPETALFNAAALSVRSQVNSASSRPK